MQNRKVYGYTLLRPLGQGGMAEVWYAENEMGKKVAVKFLLPKHCSDTDVLKRFRTEAEVMVKLKHPNIRQVYDYSEVEGRPCMVMEYLEGSDLAARMKNGERFTEGQLRKWWNQLAAALNHMHEQGVVHRDIKPSNIFVTTEGEVKLLDFGIAKVRDSIVSTHTGATMGTLMYMSPEQVRDSKHIDYRTDLYSLAVTFVHLLTGNTPYDHSTTDDFEIRNNIVNVPLSMAGIPAAWRNFLRPYLAKKPEERPALTVFRDRADVMGVSKVKQGPSALEAIEVSGASSRRPKAWPWVLAVCAVLAVALVVTLTMRRCGDAKSDEVAGKSVEADGNKNEEKLFKNEIVTVNGVSFTMVAVEGGTFWMGCTGEQSSDCEGDEIPAHSVRVSNFYIGETEVTQELWKAVMPSNPSIFKGSQRPVETVNWDDIQTFIKKLNRLTGKTFRLPTEAEWEYAARGGNQSKTANKYSGSSNIGYVAWYCGNSGGETHQVRKKAPNELGLYDMSGNVFEWCQDVYDKAYYGDSPSDNPQGPAATKNSFHVYRGGSWRCKSDYCRVSNRGDEKPTLRFGNLGFRLVLVP